MLSKYLSRPESLKIKSALQFIIWHLFEYSYIHKLRGSNYVILAMLLSFKMVLKRLSKLVRDSDYVDRNQCPF